MLYWIEIGLLVVLVPVAFWASAKALRNVIEKAKGEGL